MRFKSRMGIILCEIAGQNVLIAAQHLRDEVPYITILNDTGAFIWKHLEDGADENELCQLIEKEFDIDQEDSVKEDIHSWIVQLLDRKYIQEIKT